MRKLKIFTHTVLLMCTFTSFAYPQSNFPFELFQMQNQDCKEGTCPYTINNLLSSYDLFLQLLDDIETDEIENKCNEEELNQINHFLALLARQGLLPGDDEEELERDIEELLSDDDEDEDEDFSFGRNDGYLFAPANRQYELLLCRSRVSKTWKKTKRKTGRFCKKHKKGLIIGSAVVLGGVGVILAVASCATTAAAVAIGAAGAAASGSRSSDSNHSESKKSETKEELPAGSSVPKYMPSHLTEPNETPVMQGVIDEHISSFKELLVEDKVAQEAISSKGWDELSFGEKAREIGANIAHQAFDEISELVKVVPQLCEEVEEMGSKFLPESLTPPNNGDVGSPIENYENLGNIGHQVIDKVFSTEQSELFTAAAKANDPINNFAIGMLPLPGGIPKIFSNTNSLIKAGNAIDKAGFTRVGRGLMKHGNREGSVFPKPLGNPSEMNRRGETILKEILNHPKRTIFKNNRGGIEIYTPSGRGAYFREDGTFRGFIEYGHK